MRVPKMRLEKFVFSHFLAACLVIPVFELFLASELVPFRVIGFQKERALCGGFYAHEAAPVDCVATLSAGAAPGNAFPAERVSPSRHFAFPGAQNFLPAPVRPSFVDMLKAEKFSIKSNIVLKLRI